MKVETSNFTCDESRVFKSLQVTYRYWPSQPRAYAHLAMYARSFNSFSWRKKTADRACNVISS